ncbi:threonine synthase [Aminobacter aminovorans]|uniref:threonine synthase n=1 Tax=Aminobacter aminovorans TaxID=83263 RepID=UPI0024C10715|nr:pyridoxal-phosphate dependent enzyme [Aminobacter aminovorans]
MQYPLEVDYDYEQALHLDFGGGTRMRMDHWAPLLPPLHPRANLEVGGTPLIDLSAIAPSQYRERGVFLKDESRNPTWSHKDRLNACTVSAALAVGASTIIVSSSGNHGVSAAAHAARAGLNCIVITMPDVSQAFRDMILAYGAFPVYVPAEGRWPLMHALTGIEGTHPVSNLTPVHTGHPWGAEGYKTIAYELYGQLGDVPAALVIPTGYGEMLFGIHKGFRELKQLGVTSRLPKIFAVEPAARGPLYHAMATGVEAVQVEARPTRQSGTACTVNSYRAVVALRESNGEPMLVSDEAAEKAQHTLAREGIWQELSPSAAFAALAELDGVVDDGPIVVIGCSTGLKEPASPGLAREIMPDLASVRAYLRSEFHFEL